MLLLEEEHLPASVFLYNEDCTSNKVNLDLISLPLCRSVGKVCSVGRQRPRVMSTEIYLVLCLNFLVILQLQLIHSAKAKGPPGQVCDIL